jgi:hypothetical protein
MNVKFRADVHGSRGMPEEFVQYLPTQFTTLGDSTGQVTASGSWQVSENTTVTWSGGTQLHSVDPVLQGQPPVDTIESSGVINPLTGTVDAFQLISRGRLTESVTNEPAKSVAAGAYFIVPLVQPRINPGSNAFMAGSYTIPPGGGAGGGVSWPTTLPVMAPTAETVR